MINDEGGGMHVGCWSLFIAENMRKQRTAEALSALTRRSRVLCGKKNRGSATLKIKFDKKPLWENAEEDDGGG
jgi:hypothetical protein